MTHKPRHFLPLWLFGLLAAGMLAAGAVVFAKWGQNTTPAKQPAVGREDVSFPVGEFSFTERSGKPVTHRDLAGNVWVAAFVFTRCTGGCPQVSATMARLQKDLAGQPGVKLVTFTVDPTRDDPAELSRYANTFRADPDRWLFLTGGEEQVHKLMQEQFKLSVGRNVNPKPGDEFNHSFDLAVVDKAGTVRGYFKGLPKQDDPDGPAKFEAGYERLKAKIAKLLAE